MAMYIFIILLSINGYISCFQILETRNRATMRLDAQVSLRKETEFWGKCPGVAELTHVVTLIFN